jgi:hypothetical protein
VKVKRKITRTVTLAALVLFGLLVGCARDGSNPMETGGEGEFLDEITFLTRTHTSPGLSGEEPIVVSFTVTQKEGGRGDAGFVSFEVEPYSVNKDVELTIVIEDPTHYYVDLDAPRGTRLRRGVLSIQISNEDLTASDANDISVYRQTWWGGWKKVSAQFDEGSNTLVIKISKMSRYALSRE